MLQTLSDNATINWLPADYRIPERNDLILQAQQKIYNSFDGARIEQILFDKPWNLETSNEAMLFCAEKLRAQDKIAGIALQEIFHLVHEKEPRSRLYSDFYFKKIAAVIWSFPRLKETPLGPKLEIMIPTLRKKFQLLYHQIFNAIKKKFKEYDWDRAMLLLNKIHSFYVGKNHQLTKEAKGFAVMEMGGQKIDYVVPNFVQKVNEFITHMNGLFCELTFNILNTPTPTAPSIPTPTPTPTAPSTSTS